MASAFIDDNQREFISSFIEKLTRLHSSGGVTGLSQLYISTWKKHCAGSDGEGWPSREDSKVYSAGVR